MNRQEAVQRIMESARGALEIEEGGSGWPTFGVLNGDEGPIRIALYVGVIGESHRGRDASECRFQNPGSNRPIEHSPESKPLLIGVVQAPKQGGDLLIGFDARRRLGKRTRYSMFAPTELIEAGLKQGWTTGANATDESLVAFRGEDFARYVEFRFGRSEGVAAMSTDMTDTAALLSGVTGLMGLESIAGLGQRLADELASTTSEDPTEVWSMLTTLAERERLVRIGEELNWEGALGAAAILDRRIGIMLGLLRELSPSSPMPLSHVGLVSRIHEHPYFLAREAPDDLESAVFEIAKQCEPDLGTDDLEVFIADGTPTLFFYESVRSHFAAMADAPAKAGGVDDEEVDEEEDADLEEQTQPVKANVDKLQVIQIFNLVSKGRLDIEPPWQRKDVWSLKRKRELIKSLILGIPLPSIILHEKDGRTSIIDGKQRLTAIMQFLQNEWKLPNYPATTGSPLNDCRGAFYSKDGKRSLSEDTRDTLELRNIPVLMFENVPESRLRRIFELYNVTGMKLNAAEIRNAVYQSNPIHRTIYLLAGEGDGQLSLGLQDSTAARGFADRLRAIYQGSKKRYQGVDFLGRYLGYSRAVQRPGTEQFRIPSTSAAINNFFDYQSGREDPVEIAKELISVMDGAERFFDIGGERLAFFVRNDKGKRHFNKLVATTHMVGARFLINLIDKNAVTELDARRAAAVVATPPPQKQQRATIWDYQARVLLGLRDELEVEVADVLEPEWVEFFEKMEYCRLPEEEEA